MWGPRTGAAAAVATTIALGAPAVAAGAWTPPLAALAADRTATSPVSAPLPGGSRLLAWTSAATTDANEARRVEVAVRAADGTVGPSVVVAQTAAQSRVEVTTTADGTATLAWTRPSTGAIGLARRAPDGTVTELPPLALAGAESVTGVRLAAAGTDVHLVVASGRISPDVRSFVRGATLVQGAAAAGPLVELEAYPGQTLPPTITFADPVEEQDAARFAWSAVAFSFGGSGNTTDSTVEAVRVAGGTFGTVTALQSGVRNQSFFPPSDSGVLVEGPDLAVGPSGAVAAWLEASGLGTRVVLRRLDPGGSSGITATSAVAATALRALEAGVDDDGAVVAVGLPQVEGPMHATTFPPLSGPAPAPEPLGVTSADPSFDLARSPSGGLVALVVRRAGSQSSGSRELVALRRPAGGPFGPLEPVSSAAARESDLPDGPQLLTSGGDVAALWVGIDGSGRQRALVATRDDRAPVLQGVTIPTTATQGVAAAFSATADEPGSTIVWDFGDGATASGTAVRHAYAEAGTFTVTVRATDVAGNVATQQRTVAVTAAAPATGTPAPAADTTKPVVSAFRSTRARFRVGPRSTATVAQRRAAAGTVLRATVSERSTLVIEVVQGRRVVATLVRAGRGPGVVDVPFSGRVGGRALAPRTYRARIVAIDGAGNRSAPRAALLRIVRR